ncbi:MAG: response regulator transcription factor, partial [Candidatus Rokuibacteriota bacterium]
MARILLADDERHIGDMVTFKLTNGGHHVLRAHDGEEALRLAATERPDLLILDVMMPVLDGFQVLRQLKADPALAPIPVIMLTARGRESDVLTGLSGGAVDYVVKPFEADVLRS